MVYVNNWVIASFIPLDIKLKLMHNHLNTSTLQVGKEST